MSRPFVRKPARSVTFTDADGRKSAKVRIGETGGRGNKHFNPRQPNGPICGSMLPTGSQCHEPWQPVCSNRDCPGSTVPRRMMRIEKHGFRADERRRKFGP